MGSIIDIIGMNHAVETPSIKLNNDKNNRTKNG
jgi:hypothetical protein